MLRTKILDYWSLSRTALAGTGKVISRYDRMIYIRDTLRKFDTELVRYLSAKSLWLEIEKEIEI